MNEILKGLLKVTQDVAKLAVEVATTPVVYVESRPRSLLDELFDTPRRVDIVEVRPRHWFDAPGVRPKRICTANTPWQVCEDRNCFRHRNEDRRDMSKLR